MSENWLLISFYSSAGIWAPLIENAPPKQAIKETPRTRKKRGWHRFL